MLCGPLWIYLPEVRGNVPMKASRRTKRVARIVLVCLLGMLAAGIVTAAWPAGRIKFGNLSYLRARR